MRGNEVEQLVLLSRYTTLAGSGGDVIRAAPIDASRYASTDLSFWRGDLIDDNDSPIVVTLEESSDLENWFVIGTLGATSPGEYTDEFSFSMRWMRLSVHIPVPTGPATKTAFTCWAVGNFALRDE